MSELSGQQTPIVGVSSWRPFKCPVCEGHGIVPNGFYMYPAGQGFNSTSTSPEKCRACNGRGVIWEHG